MKELKELKTIVLLIGIMIAMAGCSVGDTDGSADYNTEASSSNAAGWGVYEGEWTVNKQVVDTARLVVAATMRVRLPEQYLLGLCFRSAVNQDAFRAVRDQAAVAFHDPWESDPQHVRTLWIGKALNGCGIINCVEDYSFRQIFLRNIRIFSARCHQDAQAQSAY